MKISLTIDFILSTKIQFKGRFDKWKRARSLVFTYGSFPVQSYNSFVDFGSSTGITKNGSFGLRIWNLLDYKLAQFSSYKTVKNFLDYSL